MSARTRRATPGRGRFVAGVDHWRTQPELRAFACDSPLPAIVAALLRSTTVCLYEDSVLVKEPGAAERTSWHQDLGYFHVDGTQLCTTWCPLDPADAERGAMRFVRGSHRAAAMYRPNLFVTRRPIPGTEGAAVPDVDARWLRRRLVRPRARRHHRAPRPHPARGRRQPLARRRRRARSRCATAATTTVMHFRPGAPRKPPARAPRRRRPARGRRAPPRLAARA